MAKRPIRVEGDDALITLTKGYKAVIDAADVPLIEGSNWCAMVGRNTVYAVRNDRSGSKRRTLYLHRVLMGEPEGMEVDHIDCDGLNCRRSTNLRNATPAENKRNTRRPVTNTSGIKGVSWHRSSAKWRAHIKLDGKQRQLGAFNCPTAAAVAYVKASARLHGEFGRTI